MRYCPHRHSPPEPSRATMYTSKRYSDWGRAGSILLCVVTDARPPAPSLIFPVSFSRPISRQSVLATARRRHEHKLIFPSHLWGLDLLAHVPQYLFGPISGDALLAFSLRFDQPQVHNTTRFLGFKLAHRKQVVSQPCRTPPVA
jgi:hypothetical protein